MKNITIRLESIEKVKNFVNIVCKYDGDYDLISQRYVVDAKSIMGIFSLDLLNPIVLNVHDDSEFDAIKAELSPYIVEA